MNERIKQLAERAGFLNKDEESIEYFAELIIRECAEVASDYDGADYIGREMKKHFGVEE